MIQEMEVELIQLKLFVKLILFVVILHRLNAYGALVLPKRFLDVVMKMPVGGRTTQRLIVMMVRVNIQI
jgi:hypothetical protein